MRILWLSFVIIFGNKKWQRFARAGARNNKKKTMDRHTRGLAQKEEQLLGVSSHYSTKQPLRTHSLLRASQKYTLHPKHKEDKPWTWVATIRSDAPACIMDQFRAMTSLHTDGVITIAAERENKQSKSEEQLWKWLKNRSITT